ARLRQGLNPEAREQVLLLRGVQCPAHRVEALGAVSFLDERRLPDRTDLQPRLVDAREVQVPLRREVPVEDRLADAGLACDLRSRRPPVAPLREHPAGGLEDSGAPLRRGEPGPDGAHAASNAPFGSRSSACRGLRTVRTASTAPVSANPAATWSPRW